MKENKEYEEFIKEQKEIYQSIKDDLDKIMWMLKEASLESDNESANNINDLAKKFMIIQLLHISNSIRYIDITSIIDESSLNKYLDDAPEGFINEWGDHKGTPFNMRMKTHNEK